MTEQNKTELFAGLEQQVWETMLSKACTEFRVVLLSHGGLYGRRNNAPTYLAPVTHKVDGR